MDKAYNLSNFEALFGNYLLAENKDLSQTTIKNYSSDFKHFLGWVKSTIKEGAEMDEVQNIITPEVVNGYLAYLEAQRVPLKTVNRRLSTLRKFIQFCQEKDLIQNSRNFSIKNLTNVKKIDHRENGSIVSNIHNSPPVRTLSTRFVYSWMLLIISVSAGIIGFIHLSNIVASAKDSSVNLSTSSLKSGRVFAFQGKLTDKAGGIITSSTPIQFRLYSSQNSGAPLYQSGSCTITPDRNGYFSVLLGGIALSPKPIQDACGKEVDGNIFNDNSSIYLGMSIGGDKEMSPRQQIANVGYAHNAQMIQGLPLGSNESNVPYITSDGTVILSVNSPSIVSTYESSNFSIRSNDDLTLQTANDGDITLTATGSGSIALKTSNSANDRIYIANSGNVGINNSNPFLFQLQVAGDIGPDLSSVYNLGSSTKLWNDLFVDRICFDGSSDCMTSSSGLFSAIESGDSTKLNIKGNVTGGTNVTSGTTTLDIGGNGTSFALCHSSQSNTDNEQIVDCTSTPTADFAEMYPVEKGVDFGDVMTLGEKIVRTTTGDSIRQLVKGSKAYDHHVIGIVSDNFDDFISVGHNIKKDDNPLPIALKGRVPVKIAQSSAPIEAGDYLTTSPEAGKAMKLVKDGVAIGKALEAWTPGQVQNKIMVFVGIDYVAFNRSSWDELTHAIQVNLAQPFETLLAQKVVSPVIETTEIQAKPGKDLTIDLDPQDEPSKESQLAIKGIRDAIVASVDTRGNIKSKGTIEAENGIFNDTLRANKIEGKTIDSINENINDVQLKLNKLSESPLPSPSTYTIPDTSLDSIEHELLAKHLVVTESADIFALAVQERIEARSDKLVLSAGSHVSFFDGSVTISKDGDIVTAGTITAKELQIKNPAGETTSAITSTGSAQFNTLALAKSAGTAMLPEGENEVKVFYDDLKESSLVYLTPEDSNNYVDKPLSVREKYVCEANSDDCENYFIVGMGTDNHDDLRFNWLIVN